MSAKLRPLSGLDASFLYLEAMGTPMHVGSLMLLEAPADGVDFHAALLAHVGRRLRKARALRRVLEPAPLELTHPMWREMAPIDLADHILRRKLARPGGMAQVQALVAKLHAEPLDRSKPLWQFVVIEGLADGRIALYSKVHHALIDGQGGVALAQALLDLEPGQKRAADAEVEGLEPAGATPGRRAVMGTAMRSALGQFARLLRAVPATLKVAAQAVRSGEGSLLGRIRDTVSLAPRTPFNVQVGPARSFATLSLPLERLKQVAKGHAVSLNDVVLAVCGGALRTLLLRRKALPARSLVAAMPVSLRAPGDGEINNQVSMVQCSLATELADPLARLQAIRTATLGIKDKVAAVRSLIPTDYPGLAAPIWVSGLSRLWSRGRIAEKLPPLANLAISNVPGPPFAVYLAGARLLHYFPVSIVTHGLALNITVQSYAGWLEFGVVACKDVLPRPQALMDAISQELERLDHALAH